MKKTITVVAVILVFAACKKNSLPVPVTDNSSADVTTGITTKYSSIKIGTQKWMTKNLDVIKYSNGDKIPQVKVPTKWKTLTTGAWCWYNNDSATGAVYGRLYNWYAVNDPRGLAPAGWHIPSDAEWKTLTTFLGDNPGGKLKETGTTHWLSPNTDATNESGFTGLPGGHRLSSGSFFHIGNYGNWWSSTQVDTTNAWNRTLTNLNGNVARSYHDLQSGFSVRCVRD